MIKRLKKPAAVLCAVLIALSFAGCSDTSWVVKVDGNSVPSGVYLTYLISARGQVMNGGSSSSASSSASSTDNFSLGSSSAASSAIADPWAAKIEGKDAYSWAISQAEQSTELLAYVQNLCKKDKVTLTTDETDYTKQLAQQYMQQYSSYAANGVSEDSLQKVFEFYYLSSKLFTHYYGDGGSKAVAASDLKDYYSKNYVQIKQVFFNGKDDSGNALTGDKLNEVINKANNVASQLKADPNKLADLIKQYNEDTAEPADGYVFNKDATYLQEFKDAAFAMADGEVRVVKTSMGYHVMYKVKLDPNGSGFTSNKSDVLQAMKGTEYNTMLTTDLKKCKIEVNDSAISKYDPKTLKDQ